MRRCSIILLVASCVLTLPGCQHGKKFLADTLGSLIYGGLSQIGDTSRPANERGTAAFLEGNDAGLDFGRAIESQFPD